MGDFASIEVRKSGVDRVDTPHATWRLPAMVVSSNRKWEKDVKFFCFFFKIHVRRSTRRYSTTRRCRRLAVIQFRNASWESHVLAFFHHRAD